jgi:hypothetical protein
MRKIETKQLLTCNSPEIQSILDLLKIEKEVFDRCRKVIIHLLVGGQIRIVLYVGDKSIFDTILPDENTEIRLIEDSHNKTGQSILKILNIDYQSVLYGDFAINIEIDHAVTIDTLIFPYISKQPKPIAIAKTPSDPITIKLILKLDVNDRSEVQKVLDLLIAWKALIVDTEFQSYRDLIWRIEYKGLSGQVDRFQQQLEQWILKPEDSNVES